MGKEKEEREGERGIEYSKKGRETERKKGR